MGIGTYFIGLIVSGLAALFLRAVIGWSTEHWRPTDAVSGRNVIRAVLRGLPIAVAFAPSILMKRGLGVLLPASITLFAELLGELQALVSHGHPLDADDRKNLANATGIFILVWGISTVIYFLGQSSKIERQGQSDIQKPDK
jgi:hypothetical protein